VQLAHKQRLLLACRYVSQQRQRLCRANGSAEGGFGSCGRSVMECWGRGQVLERHGVESCSVGKQPIQQMGSGLASEWLLRVRRPRQHCESHDQMPAVTAVPTNPRQLPCARQ
jgi:hypothetical protein